MDIREWLRVWQFWWLEAGFLLVFVTTALNWRACLTTLDVRPPAWLLALALAATTVVLVFTLPPRTNRIYYDEQIYQSIGQNLSDLRQAQICNHGNVDTGRLQCVAPEYNKQPYGYPHLLSVVYRAFGVRDGLAQMLNSYLAGFTVLALFILVVQLTGAVAAGLLAGLVLMLTPEFLLWSATAAAEPSSAFFALVAAVATAHYVRQPASRSLWWMVAAVAYAAQFRPESILILAIAGVIVLTQASGEFRRRAFWLGMTGGGVLLAALMLHMYEVRTEGWGTPGERLSIAYVVPNLRVNGWFYLWDSRFPMWYSVAAVAGIVFGAGRLRDRLVLVMYFAVFFVTYLFFYAGSYNYGADVRYSMMTYVPLAALAGLALAAAVDRFTMGTRPLRYAVVAIAVVWAFSWFTPYVRAEGDEAWGARADEAFAKEMSMSLPANSLVLTHNPGMFHLWGRNAAQMSLATEFPELLTAWKARYGNRIYLHWNFWCNVADPAQQAFCRKALEQFPHVVLTEQTVRDYRFAFYQLSP
ncbi:MAG: hypothetical protein ABI024_17660 [Vicinamibacterales bacterium]